MAFLIFFSEIMVNSFQGVNDPLMKRQSDSFREEEDEDDSMCTPPAAAGVASVPVCIYSLFPFIAVEK